MHRNGIFHRDIKPYSHRADVIPSLTTLSSENILLKNDVIKLADFGSVATISVNKDKEHTEYVSTRWYRSPECLMTKGVYDYKVIAQLPLTEALLSLFIDGHLGCWLRLL